jgi:hypothetical protein
VSERHPRAIVLKGGTVIDGTGASRFVADVRIEGSAGTTTGRTTSARSASGVLGCVIAIIIAPCSFATSTVSSRNGIRPTCEIASATSFLFIVAAEMSCRWASK